MSDYDVVDIHRLQNPGLRQFTWRRKRPLTMRRLDFFLIFNTKMLTPDEQSVHEGELALQECWEALTSMQNGKSPGNGGFTKKIYVTLFGELGKLFVSVFEVGELSSSQKQAAFTLIQKKGRDNMLIKNWRPISLINVSIEIASKILDFRLGKVIHSLIIVDHFVYVKCGYIGESVRLIDDFLAYAE